MPPKRKGKRYLDEGDTDSAAFVMVRNVRQTGRDGVTKVVRVEENLYAPLPDQEAIPEGAPPAFTSGFGQDGFSGDAGGLLLEEEVVQKPKKRQSDYIQQFVDRIDPILEAMMDREALHASQSKCIQCGGDRIEQWTGTHFRPSSLHAVGVYILVQHRHGEPVCETLRFYRDTLEDAEALADADEQQHLSTLFTAGPRGRHQSREDAGLYHKNQEDDLGEWDDGVHADAEHQANEAFDAFLEALQENPDSEIQEPEDFEELVNVEVDAVPIMPYLPRLANVDSDMFNNAYVRVVHTTGIHQLALVGCYCGEEGSTPLNLIALHLVPTSFQQIRTLFTAAVLDEFRLCSLELKASAYQYFRLLWQITDPMAPHLVLNLYDVFRQMSRLWRWIKKLKWGGFAGHTRRSALDVKPAELANYCPACPQIGINVADNWESDPNRFVYHQIFVADGNFKADHVKAKTPSRDVWLSEAMETSTKAPCETTFRAICNALQASKACDVTGVVGIACARHGCYVPNALCNLFRGEQQKNVDYALIQAIVTTRVDPRQGCMLLYDIICQYIIYLYKRIGKHLPPGLKIIPGIGMFHIHAHKDECFFRYAPSLIPGAACVCGEILESLWSALNTISPTVRTATLAHRAEILDDHTSDSNHRKLLGMVQFLIRQFYNARENRDHYQSLFNGLDSKTPPANTQAWQCQIEQAEAAWLMNPAVMDIYGADLSLRNNAVVVLDAEAEQRALSPVELWIHLCLVIEEKQIEIRRKIRSAGKYITLSEQEEVEGMRAAIGILWMEMSSCQQLAGVNELPVTNLLLPVPHLDWEDIPDVPSDEVPEAEAVESAPEPTAPTEEPAAIESKRLPLPSYNAVDQRFCEAKIRERIQQANQHLSALREQIVDKAFQYREVLRDAPRKSVRTRSRKAVYNINQVIMYHTQVYSECRSRLVYLNPNPEIFTHFKVLQKEDVHTSMAIIAPNSAGSTRMKLSWIWQSVTWRLDPLLQTGRDAADSVNAGSAGDQSHETSAMADVGNAVQHELRVEEGGPVENAELLHETPAMVEYKRVHWLHARAQCKRWEEEFTYVKYEMQWTVKYFEYKAQWWKDMIVASRSILTAGQVAYGRRQAELWIGLRDSADKSFHNVNADYVKI